MAISYAHENVADVGIAGFGMLMLTLAGTALLFGLAGSFVSNILWGALAFAGIGIALMLIASPLTEISKVMEENSSMLWQLPLLLTELGVVFGVAGVPLFAGLIVLGAAAFAAVGLSLGTLGDGIKAFGDIGSFNPRKFKEAIIGIKDGILSISLIEALTIPLRLPAILSIAAAMAKIGIGLGIYKKNAGWKRKDSEEFKFALTSFIDVFSMDVDWASIEEGIDATWYLGKNLERLAIGIKAWEEIDFDIETVKGNITSILTTIPTIFGDIGKLENGGKPKGFWDWSKGDVEEGIDSTMKMGKNLTNLAEGIQAWEVMDVDVEAVTANIKSVLTTIPNIFADIGRLENGGQPKGFWDWSSGDVEQGIESTLSMGTNLKNLADGIQAWETMEFDQVAVTAKITGILTTIPNIFAIIGNEAKKTEGWFADSDVAKGVEIASGFSEPLMGVADVITAVSESLKTGSSPQIISDAIVAVFSALGQGLGQLTPEQITMFADFIEIGRAHV